MANYYNKELTKARNERVIKMYTIDKLSCYKIAKEVDLTPATVHRILKGNGIKTRSNKENSRKYFVNNDFFEVIDTEEKAYWLGFIYADGYITNNGNQKNFGIALEIKDKGHLERFINDLDSNYPVKVYDAKTNFSEYTYARVLITSEKMYNDLLNKGVFERKSNILRFPSYDIVPKNLVMHFIRGYIDGDGSIVRSRNSFSLNICGTSEFLLSLFSELGHKVKVEYRYQDEKGSYARLIGNIKVKSVLDIIYDSSTVYLERKYLRYKELIDAVKREEKRQNGFKDVQELRKQTLKDNPLLSNSQLGKIWNVSKSRAREIRINIENEQYN